MNLKSHNLKINSPLLVSPQGEKLDLRPSLRACPDSIREGIEGGDSKKLLFVIRYQLLIKSNSSNPACSKLSIQMCLCEQYPQPILFCALVIHGFFLQLYRV